MLDLGTGSGCIAVTSRSSVRRHTCTRATGRTRRCGSPPDNAAALGATLTLHRGDWFDALPAGMRYDVVVSNPPYVAAGDPHLATLAYEPAIALSDGADGLACLRRIVAQASGWLESGGALLVEHGFDQGPAVRALFQSAGFEAVGTQADLQGHPRLTHGCRS